MKVLIEGVLAVGLRHYANDDLIIGARYTLRRDFNNSHDFNAVAITDNDGRKKASLKRDAARLMSKLMESTDLSVNMDIGFLIKPKRKSFFHSPRFGLAQRCNIGFVCRSSDKETVRRFLSKGSFALSFV